MYPWENPHLRLPYAFSNVLAIQTNRIYYSEIVYLYRGEREIINVKVT